MTRAIKTLAAAVFVLAAVMGAASACPPAAQDPAKNQPVPADNQGKLPPEIEKTRIAFVTVESKSGFTVAILIKDPSHRRPDTRIGPKTVAAGKWDTEVSYTSGGLFDIEVNVYGAPIDAEVKCEISDGGNTYKRKALGSVICPWRTVQ